MTPKPPAKKKTVLLGAHMSIAGGMPTAIERGESIGCTAIQVFLKNNNQWKGKAISAEEAEQFRADLAKSSIRVVFGHDSYLINLASKDDVLYAKSIDAMVDEVERATLLGVPFIVIHPGSHLGEGEEWGLQRIAAGINEVFARTADSKVVIAFENTAGQGSNLGFKFEHLAALREGVKDKARTGFCLDTCHLFASGYDIRDKKSYDATMKQFDAIAGRENLLAIHMNDIKGELGCRVDRHEHIGKGRLGLEAFRLVMNDPHLAKVPKVLETPKDAAMTEDVENMDILRGLIA